MSAHEEKRNSESSKKESERNIQGNRKQGKSEQKRKGMAVDKEGTETRVPISMSNMEDVLAK